MREGADEAGPSRSMSPLPIEPLGALLVEDHAAVGGATTPRTRGGPGRWP